MKPSNLLCCFRPPMGPMSRRNGSSSDARYSYVKHSWDEDQLESIITPDSELGITLVDRIALLPPDIVRRIFSFLDVHDLKTFKLICKEAHFTYRKAVDHLKICASNTSNSVVPFFSSLDYFSSLTSLTFSDSNADSLLDLIRVLSSPRISLTEFNYNIHYWCGINTERLAQLTFALSHHPKLTNLSLHQDTVHMMAHEFLIMDILTLPNLQTLSLVLPISHLVWTKQQMERMDKLELAVYGSHSIECLLEIFCHSNLECWKNLESLKLSLWTFEDTKNYDLFPLADSLARIPNLKALDLKDFLDLEVWNLNLLLKNSTDVMTRLAFVPRNFSNSPKWVHHFPNLTHVHINNVENIQFLFGLKHLTHLKHLELCSGGVEGIGANLDFIQELTWLEILHLSFEGVCVIFPSFHNLEALKKLVLYVSFTSIIQILGICRLSLLRHLDIRLSNVQEVRIDDDWSFALKLNYLQADLTSSHCHRFFWEALENSSNLWNLTSLTLADCFDERLHFIGGLIRLKHLSLSGSRVQTLPDSFHNLAQLRNFKLSLFSKLRSLSFLHRCPLLQTLEIHDCLKLSHLPDSVFKLQFLYKIFLKNCPKFKFGKKKLSQVPCVIYHQCDRFWQ